MDPLDPLSEIINSGQAFSPAIALERFVWFFIGLFFITAISKFNNLPSTTNVINQEIKKIVKQELMSLKQKIQGLEEKINKGKERTRQLMNIENRFHGHLPTFENRTFDFVSEQVGKKMAFPEHKLLVWLRRTQG